MLVVSSYLAEYLREPWPEVLAFAQPLAPVAVLAVLGPGAALLSAATAASLEQEAAAAEAALGEAVPVAPFEVVAAAESLVAFAVADSPSAASLAVAAVAAPEVAAIVPSRVARAEYF